MLMITDMKMEKGGVLSFTVDANVASAIQCSVRNATGVQDTARVHLVRGRSGYSKRRLVFAGVNPKNSLLGCSLLDSHNRGGRRRAW